MYLDYLNDYNLVGSPEMLRRLQSVGAEDKELTSKIDDAKKVYKLTEEDGWKMLLSKLDEFMKAFSRDAESYMTEPQLVGIDCGGRLAITMIKSWIDEQNKLVENDKKYEQKAT